MALVILKAWRTAYERGEVESTCKFHDPVSGIIDKPTRYAHKITWHPAEFDHVARIVRAACPNKPLIEEVERVRAMIPRGKLRPGGRREVTLAFYAEHIDEIIRAMETARGSSKPTLAEQVEEGGLF